MTLLYSLALLVGAALIFLLEPMVGKFVLPSLGSTPEVWTTTVLFFQVALLAGYGYAHVTSRLAPRRQALLQLGLLALAALVLPVGVPDARPPGDGNPIPWLLGVLTITAGPPFLVLAANGPMLQRWLAGTRHRAARDPYFLFAASNGGSLLGLLAYPLLVERELTLDGQGELWAVGYGLAALLVVACAVVMWREGGGSAGTAVASTPSAGGRDRASSVPVTPGGSGDTGTGLAPSPPVGRGSAPSAKPPAPRWSNRLTWVALAAVPSSLMLGTTTYLTRDLSPVPLLWVVPLALYLVTLIVAFAPGARTDRLVLWSRRLLPGIAIVVAYTLAVGAARPLFALAALHLLGLLVAGLLCHARLAADRPAAEHLTEYYLWVALGGALGGAFNALVAPVAFPGLVEYPLALVAACLLRPAPPKKHDDLLEFFFRDPRPTRWMDFAVPVLLGIALAVAMLVAREDGGGVPLEIRGAIVGVALGVIVTSRRPIRFALALGAILLAAQLGAVPGEKVLERDRSFFGIYRVVESEDGHLHELYDGNTLHGSQRLAPGGRGRPDPLTYYSRVGPAGQVLATLPRAATRRVASIGLGAGALACTTLPGTDFTFFEIDPAVSRIARDPRHFTYLRDCGRPAVAIGDGRRSLARHRGAPFGLIVLDAFNSDAIPVHLLTREAIELYLRRTVPSGALMLHLSNRYADLESVVGNAARELGLTCRIQRHRPTAEQEERGYTASTWALLAREPEHLGPIARTARWKTCRDDPSAGTWTDDYSNLLGVVDWS